MVWNYLNIDKDNVFLYIFKKICGWSLKYIFLIVGVKGY